ncbi:MAG: hypothetical protein ABIQ93_05450 [Saprospiraceae bacterium]
MSDNKLFELINTLTAVEKRECTAFLKSPYHNRREDVLRLWKQCIAGSKNRRGDASDERPGNTAQQRHVQSLLLLQIETFLAQRAYEQTPLLSDLHLAPVYRQKGLVKHLDHLFRRAEERLTKLPRDTTHYHLQYQLEWEKYAATQLQTRSRGNNLAAVHQALDVYLIGSKLRLACLMESHRAVFNTAYDLTFLAALLAFLPESELRSVPIIALYYHCYQSLTSGKEDEFRAFRRELEDQNATLPPEERRTFLLLALNYCIRQLNAGEVRYIREIYDLYRVGLDTGVLLENGKLSRFAYKNIVYAGLRVNEFNWVEDFIFRYEPHLEEKHRAANRDYNLAKLYFTKKDYGRAMPLLAQVGESDLLLNLDSRVMLLKMYYETGEWDALDALMASFRVLLLRKKKVIGYHHVHYLNTLRYIQKLSRVNLNDKAAIAAFRAEVEASKAVIEKDWLLGVVRV